MTTKTKNPEDLIYGALFGMGMDLRAETDRMQETAANAVFRHLPSNMVRDYKRLAADANRQYEVACKEFEKYKKSKKKNEKKLYGEIEKFTLKMGMLEEANAMYSAYLAAGVGQLVTAYVDGFIKWLQGLGVEATELVDTLKKLEKMVKKAEREVTEAKAQRILNVLVTVVSLALGPTGTLARVAVALGGMTVHSLIDAGLGPSKGSGLGALNTGVGEITGVHAKIDSAGKKFLGAASAVLTLKMDGDEIDQAERQLRELQKVLQKAVNRFERVLRLLKSNMPKFQKAHVDLKRAAAGVESAKLRGRVAEKNLKHFKKELKKISR